MDRAGAAVGRAAGPGRAPWHETTRWLAVGSFELEFDAPRSAVWDAWAEFTMTDHTAGRYQCTIRHEGSDDRLGLVRAWKFPMPGGLIGRSWEWITDIESGFSVSFEAVAAPPLARASGTLTLHSIHERRTLLRSVERFEFVHRWLKPLSRPVHEQINTMNRRIAEQELTRILSARAGAPDRADAP